MTSERPDTSTVRIALDLVGAALDLTDLAAPEDVYDLTFVLLVQGRELRPSDVDPVMYVVEQALGVVADDVHAKAVGGYVRMVLTGGRELRSYQVADVLDSLQERLGVEGVGSDGTDRGDPDEPDE